MKAMAIEDLKGEIEHVRKRHPELSSDNAFVLWFLLAYLTDDNDKALQALLGEARDVGVDAAYQDDEARRIYVIQAKYRVGSSGAREARNEVLALAALGDDLTGEAVNLNAR